MMNKQYDWFATRIFQPELSLDELFDQGITPENTGFKTRDDYRNMASVRDQFRTEDGGFDEDAFNDAYNSSREMYNLYTNREYSKKLLEEFAYDPYEWYAPATGEIIDVSASNTPTQNGMFYSTNIAGIGENTESPYSVREIAQQQLVHDENGNQLDWTPEDKGGLLKGFFRDPLVLATYDEDTPEYDNDGNLLAIHKKGEYKLNEWGAPYYEMLGDRDAYGKEMLHYTDTFTKEGTVLNKLDFYDSDGKRKSVFGTAMRTASQILPMFLHPAVGYTWGALNAAKGIGQSIAALSKGIDSIITGEDDNEFGRTMTKMENWLARFDNSKSDYAQTHMWASAETYGDLIGSTTKQLFEQRLIANIPKQLKFLGTNIERSKMGQNMAIAYMAATSAKESYQAGIEAGLGDRQAGLLLLANTAAMWKLMDSDYGRSTLFRGSWFDDDLGKKTAKETADFMVKSTDKRYAMEEINDKMAKYGSTRLVKATKVDDAAKGLGQAANKAAQQQAKNAGKELAEEAAEEVAEGTVKNAAKNATTKGAAPGVETAAQAGNEFVEKTRWESSKEFLKKAYNQFSTSFKNKLEAFKGVEPEEYLAAMLREGVEEVAEEAIMDATKATTLALEALGVKMNDTGQKLDYGFSGKDIFDRYLLSFIGGAVGGGIFRGYSSYEQYRDNDWERVIPDYQRELIKMVSEGRGDEIIAEYKRLYDKGLLGSTALESSFKMEDDSNLNIAGDGDLSQADANLKILVGNVKFIEQVLNDEGIFDAIKKSKDPDVVKARTIAWNSEDSDYLTEGEKRGRFLMLQRIGAHQLMTHDFIKLGEDFVTARSWLTGVTKDLKGKDNLTEEEKTILDNANATYEKRIKELRQKRDDILEGKYNGEYVSSILLETEGILSKFLIPRFDKDTWALQVYGKTYNSLSGLYQKQIDEDLKIYFDNAHNFYGRNFAESHSGLKQLFFRLQGLMKPEFEKQNEALKGKRINEFHSGNYFGENFFRSLDEEAKFRGILIRLERDKAKLEEKEQTPEIQTQIAEIDKSIEETNSKIIAIQNRREQFVEHKQNFVPTNMMIQQFKDGDETLQKLVDTYHATIESETSDSIKTNFSELLQQILSIYTQIKNDGGLVQDFGELKMAEKAILSFATHLKNNLFVFENILNDTIREFNAIPSNPAKGTLFELNSSDHVSEPRVAFRNALDNFIKFIKESKYDEAKHEYDIMEDLVIKTIAASKTVEFENAFNDRNDLDHNGAYSLEQILDYVEHCFYVPNLKIGDVVENPFKTFFDIINAASSLVGTPFSSLLIDFQTKIGADSEASVTRYVENFFNEFTSSKDWTDFFIVNPDDQTNLTKVIELINTMEALLSIDNKTIEAMNEFLDDDRKLVVFDPISRRNLLKDLDALKNKIFVVLRTGLRNSGNRHEEIEKDYRIRTINDVQNLLKFWGGIEKEKRNKNFDPEEIWEEIVEESNSTNKDKLKNIKDADAGEFEGQQWNEVYSLIRAFESKLFNQWGTFAANISPEEQIDEFIKLFEVDEKYFEEILLNKIQNPYDKHRLGGFTPVETFQYLLQIISVDGIALDRAYKGVLTSQAFTPSETMTPNIPNDEQERAVRMTVAYLNNRDFWNKVKRSLIGKLKSKSWTGENEKIAGSIESHKILNNTLIIPGACGVGKTTMVGLILKQLWGDTRKTIFNAPKPETADNLAAAFGLHEDNNIVINDEFGKEGLFKFLFGENATNKFDIICEKDTGKLKIDRSKYGFLEVSPEKLEELGQYEILIIDEIGQYNEIELELIDEIAEKANILVIGLGDHCQIGDIIEYTKEGDPKIYSDNSNYQDLEVWKTPYLVRSMRSTSVSKATNNEKLGQSIYTIESVNYLPDTEVSRMIKENSVANQPIEVRLTYSGKCVYGFCGDKITSNEDDFNDMWDHIIETKKPEDTVSIVIDSDDKKIEWTERIKKLNAKDGEYIIKDIRKNEINGYETSYTIVDINWADRITNQGIKTVWKEFYTISQRSYYATLFFDKTDSLKDIRITSQFDKDAFRVWENKPEFTRKRYESRMKLLEPYSSIVLFAPTDRLAKLNHSVDDDDEGKDDEPALPPPPPPFGGSGPEAAVEPEPEPEPEENTLQVERDKLESKIETIFENILNAGFIYNNGNINAPEFSSIETLNEKDVNEKLNIVEKLLSEINTFLQEIPYIDADVKSVITDAMDKQIRVSKQYLEDVKTALDNRLIELTKDDSTKAKETYKNVIAEIEELDDKNTETITDEITVDTEILNKLKNLERLIGTWSKDVVDSISAELGYDLVTRIKQRITTYEDYISNGEANLKNKKDDYLASHPVKSDSDDVDDVDLDALSPTEKTELISKIDNLVSEYQKLKDAITDDDKNDNDINNLVEDYERQLNQRISELKQIKNKLKTTPAPNQNANYTNIKTQAEKIRQDMANKKINLRQAFDLVQAVIELAENTLTTDSTLTDAERATIENLRDGWKQWMRTNEHMLQTSEPEKVQRTNEVQPTTGFEVNQTTSERAALNIAETETALQYTEGNLTIDDVVKNKFTEEGKKIYDDLVRRTANGQIVTVWGLDLETTGTNINTARIVQIGLVQYTIARNKKGEWKVSVVPGSGVSKFVKPSKEAGSTTDDNMTPPEKLNGEDNPILSYWQSGTKISEEDALEEIFRTISRSSDVITYNGFAYDMNVLRIRAAKLGITSASIIDSWKQIDVYKDFINPTGKTGGKDLMWKIGKTGKELIPQTSVSKLETFTKTIGRANTEKDYHSDDWQLVVGKSHDAKSDVDATLNVLMNMFNGIDLYINSQTVHSSKYESNLMDDDLYFKEVLLPKVKELHETKYPDDSVEELFTAFAELRHKVLKGEVAGDKKWRYDENTKRSTLYYIHKLTGDEVPLLVVNGERRGKYEGTFTYHKMDISKRASDDIDLLELRKRYPTIRISKPFVLTGVKYNEVGSLENLSDGARQFYDPEKATHNLGKTFVLITEDPSFEDNWDPKLALSGNVREDGTVDWTSQKFEMLTVSRTANIQEMIDFSIASCALASDHLIGGQYMKDFFDKWHKDGDDVKIAAGVTLSNTQYEMLYNNLSYSEGLKLYRSPIFSVMDSRNVGDFLAGFINGCAKNATSIEGLLSDPELNKPVDQWLFNNIIESIMAVPYSKLEETYDQYYSIDVTINGKVFKIICDGTTHNLHVFLKEPSLNIADEIANINKPNTKCLLTIDAPGSNKVLDLYDFFENYFGNSKIGDTLFFDNISLKTTQLGKDKWEHEYNVFTSEVFTRTFTTWSNTLSQPVGLKGWDKIFEVIKEDVAGFTHGIFGHEIIDKSPNATIESSIFSMSICNNSLNGEYVARTARLRRYGYWQVNDDNSEVDEFKKKITDRVGQISKLYPNLKDTLDAEIETLSANVANMNLSDDEIDTYIINVVNRLLREMSKDKTMIVFVNSSGEFESKTTYKSASELPDNLGYNKDYYWVNTECDTKAYIVFEGDTPAEFCIEMINTKDPYVVSFRNGDYKTSLFKNLLLSLWDKNFKLNGLENYGYLRYFMHQVRAAKDGNGVGDVIISAVRECILGLPDAEKDKIFTKELQEALIAADTDLENLIDSGLDFYEALDISNFDVFAVIEEICN